MKYLFWLQAGASLLIGAYFLVGPPVIEEQTIGIRIAAFVACAFAGWLQFSRSRDYE